ncbi:MAG: lysine 2,3-aminomutase [Melioribacteraceae bacterium]|nr:lysine 2,3-aminomutase [Melioribacteraceae bacterium]
MILEKKLKFYGLKDLEKIPQFNQLPEEQKFETKVVSHVLPFRTNNYIVEELIDWNNIPADPMFQLTFMQKGMLANDHFNRMADALRRDLSKEELKEIADDIRREMNPHPAGQAVANVPVLDDEPVAGVQHKYRETCLVFPTGGQTCHAYCTFCFRWAQFVNMDDLQFATDESKRFQQYLKEHKEISDVLFTGGDPMVMSYQKLNAYIEPLLGPEFDHIKNIRIGTKSLTYWPYKYVTDKDADKIIDLFDRVVDSGKHLAIMAHVNHHVELSTDVVNEAIRRIKKTGAQIRTQSPLIQHINDDSKVWSTMWKKQVNLGLIPYYFFVERDTGPKNYFAVPLHRAVDIFRDAYSEVSGLCRTVRGPSMSATPGKIQVEGITEINGEKAFVLNFLQGRNAKWVKNPFFAKYDEDAIWLDDLKPFFGDKFFFEKELDEFIQKKTDQLGKNDIHVVNF